MAAVEKVRARIKQKREEISQHKIEEEKVSIIVSMKITQYHDVCGCISMQVCCLTFVPATDYFIGTSQNEPHTSGKNGTSIVFTKIYMENTD